MNSFVKKHVVLHEEKKLQFIVLPNKTSYLIFMWCYIYSIEIFILKFFLHVNNDFL
jgi:hypothetical protein